MASGDNFLDDLTAAMEAPSSPTPSSPSTGPLPTVLGKRPRTVYSATTDGAEDEENEDSADPDELQSTPEGSSEIFATHPGIARPSNRNLAAFARRCGVSKKLRTEQLASLDSFAADTVSAQLIKLYAQTMAVENKLEKIVQAAPPFTVSEDLTKDISEYAMAVLLSSKIPSYKGNIPRDHVLSVLKKFRVHLPDNIEHVPSDWAKVVSAVGNALTQMRSQIKKTLIGSMADDPKDAVHLFDLTQQLVAKSNCRITVPLCARVALMRRVLSTVIVKKGETQDKKYWDKIDSYLKHLHTAAGNNPTKLVRAFKKLMKEDREKYGQGSDFEVQDEVVDERQQQVDDVIEGIVE